MLDHIFAVFGEAHAFIISGEPAGYGWLLGIGLLLLRNGIVCNLGPHQSDYPIRPASIFKSHRENQSFRCVSGNGLYSGNGSSYCL